MKHYISIVFIVAMLLGCILMVSYADGENNRKKHLCEDHGGTWFYHEQRCLDIKSIPVR